METKPKKISTILAGKSLETIIVKLEKWQAKYGSHDEHGSVGAAKSALIQLLNRIEKHRD